MTPPNDRHTFGRCAKYGCHKLAVTVERDPDESHPNALCLSHAVQPARVGTFDAPVIIRNKRQP
jgi:hypothetical protein